MRRSRDLAVNRPQFLLPIDVKYGKFKIAALLLSITIKRKMLIDLAETHTETHTETHNAVIFNLRAGMRR